MKIGILTFHRAHNYGAVLQCFALQEYIRKCGHEAWVIDYHQKHIERFYKKKLSLRGLIINAIRFKWEIILNHFKTSADYNVRCERFERFREKYLYLTPPCTNNNIPDNLDRYIIGSDQMWGLHCTGGYDKVYWGQFKRKSGSRLYGYAISSNGDFEQMMSLQRLISDTSSFDGLSFREVAIKERIEYLTGIKSSIAIDPTLLADADIWNRMLNSEWSQKKYVVLYNIRSNASLIAAKALKLAEVNNWEIVDLSKMDYDVEDFVSAIKYAKCVLTSSFHATVFSIIFGTPFYSFLLKDGHDGRYENLLKILHLEDHIRCVDDEITKIVPVNKSAVDVSLNDLRKPSKEFINKVLEK